MLKKVFHLVFDFFASLKLAISLLIILGATLAVGTFIESMHGAKAAQQVIYKSVPFNILLGVLGINVAFAALDRLPWQRKHIGFLMTHAGILLILLGSWMTHRFAIEGQLALAEGEKGNRITLEEPLLQVAIPHSDRKTIAPLKPTPFPWQGRHPIALSGFSDLDSSLLAYYPHAEAREKIVSKTGGKPAVQIVIFNESMRTGGWLLEGDNERDRIDLGPATIRFASQMTEEEKAVDPKGTLILQLGEREIKIPVSEALEKAVSLPDTPFSIKIKRHLPHAIVSEGQLINQSEEPVNPACEVLLQGDGIQEAHTVFAKFPDFPTIHGLKPSQTGIRIRYESPGLDQVASNELRILNRGRDGLSYQVKTKGVSSKEIPLEIGKAYSTGWMNFQFQVMAFQPEAEYEFSFEPRPMPSEGKTPNPAALIEFEKGGEKRKVWFTPGQREIFFLNGTPLDITYGMRIIPLGFDLALINFMIEYYPGTNRPASFKSNVSLEDSSLGLTRQTVISMNKPLSHRGFKIYQSGYQLNQGEPDVSIFAVGRDPGIPVKYTGSIVMILGILTMFYMKKFSNLKPIYPENNS